MARWRSLFFSSVIDDEREVTVGEELVGDLLDLSFFQMRPRFLVGHVEGDDVADADVTRKGIAGGEAVHF